MSAVALLTDLRSRGVELMADGDKLRWRAPTGVLGDADRGALVEHKADVLALLCAGRLGYCGHCDAPVEASPDPEGLGEHGYRCPGCEHNGWLPGADAPTAATPVAPDVAAFIARLPLLRTAHERSGHGCLRDGRGSLHPLLCPTISSRATAEKAMSKILMMKSVGPSTIQGLL